MTTKLSAEQQLARCQPHFSRAMRNAADYGVDPFDVSRAMIQYGLSGLAITSPNGTAEDAAQVAIELRAAGDFLKTWCDLMAADFEAKSLRKKQG